jgi:aldehyde:ferredoxin oxidoreductase
VSKFLRVNTTTGEVRFDDAPETYQVLGGRAVTSQLLLAEVPPTCDPLGPYNKLIIAPGLLSGTTAPSSGRLSVGGKSPLTGGIKEANAGGIASQKLANLGLKAIILEGKPAGGEWRLLKVTTQGAELVPADDLAGKGTYEVTAVCRERYGKQVAVISIGPAGEMLMRAAGVTNNDGDGHSSRYAGRGGLGAVMGSKRIKAIVVDSPTTFEAPVQEPERFKAAAKKFTQILLSHPVTGQGLPNYGTNVLMNIINESGALPTRNFRFGRFDLASEVSGEKLAEVAVARGGKATHACHPGCVMRCSNVYPLPDGQVCAPVEYETAWGFGPNLEIGDLDVIARLNYLCNDVGLDTIETGCTLGVLMEAGVLPFGDGAAALKALEEVARGTPLGRIIGSGSANAGRVYGVTRVAAVKGQGIPAYDPRACMGNGVTYATTPMGADHTAGYAVTANLLKVGGYVDPLKPEGQVELSRNLQIATAFVDSTGFCLFIAFALLDNPEGLPTVMELLNAKYGLAWTVEDALLLGKRVLKAEREFNLRAGFTGADDRLPEFFHLEELPPHNTVFAVEEGELDQVFNFTGV